MTARVGIWTPTAMQIAKECCAASETIAEAHALFVKRTGHDVSHTGFRMAFRDRSEGSPGRYLGKPVMSGDSSGAAAPTVTAPPATNEVMGRVRSSIAIIGSASPGRHRVAHITDIHHGSKHNDAKALLESIERAVSAGCEAIVCTGDTLDGCGAKLANEQRAIGFDDQVQEAIEVWSASAAAKAKIPIVAISGNHDSYFNDAVGIETGRVLGDRMKEAGVDWRYIGSCMGRAIVFGAKCDLYHPHGGGATRNAVRRVLNAKAERYEPHDRPDILFGGHFHKFAVVDAYPEEILCVGGGTFQLRHSDFGVRMIHPWDTGHGIVSWTIAKDGRCHEKSAEFYAVRTEARGWAA